jgi:hypothetical protein
MAPLDSFIAFPQQYTVCVCVNVYFSLGEDVGRYRNFSGRLSHVQILLTSHSTQTHHVY